MGCVYNWHCVDHSSNNIDDYGYTVPKSQPYFLCKYLEILNDKKGTVYKRSKKKTFSFTKKVLCTHSLSLNQIIIKIRFNEILNCVQFTAMGLLF